MALLILLMLASPRTAPEAAFSIDDDGFLTVTLAREGKPLDGTIRIYEGPPGDGETVGGVTTVTMLKPGQSCLLGIRIAGKECDLIALERHGKETIPARVSLTFGTRPCCVNVSRPRPVEEPEVARSPDASVAWMAALGGGCLLAGLALVFIRGKA